MKEKLTRNSREIISFLKQNYQKLVWRIFFRISVWHSTVWKLRKFFLTHFCKNFVKVTVLLNIFWWERNSRFFHIVITQHTVWNGNREIHCPQCGNVKNSPPRFLWIFWIFSVKSMHRYFLLTKIGQNWLRESQLSGISREIA